jgi:hypothetical protein
MSQQVERSELEDQTEGQKLLSRRIAVVKVIVALVGLSAGILFLGREVVRIQLKSRVESSGKTLALAAYLYSGDHDDVLPLAQNWDPLLQDYSVETLFVEHDYWYWNGRKTRFAMNEKLAGDNLAIIEYPYVVPIFFLSTLPGPSATGGEEDVAYDELGYTVVSCADISAQMIKKERVERFLWTAPVKSPPR